MEVFGFSGSCRHRYSKSPDMELTCYMWWFELGAPHILGHLNIWLPINDTVPWFRRYGLVGEGMLLRAGFGVLKPYDVLCAL